MSRIAVPRWALFTMVLAFVASMAFSIGAYSSVFGSSHEDTPFYACMYAGSLSQVSTNPPANCGRGTQVTWPSYADFVALQQQLDSDVTDLWGALNQEITDREAGDAGLLALINVLTQRVSDLENENEQQAQAIQDLVNALVDEVLARETDIQALYDALFVETSARALGDTNLQTALNTEIIDRSNADTDLQNQINGLQTQINTTSSLLTDLKNTVGTIWQAVRGILSGDFSGVVTLLQDVQNELGQVGTVVNNFMNTVFTAVADWFCDGPLGFLCTDD